MYTVEIEYKCHLLSLWSIYIAVLVKLQCGSPLPLILHTLTKADIDWEGHAVIPDQKIIMRYVAS